MRDEGQGDGLRARRDDRLVEGDELLRAVLRRDLQRIGRGEGALAGDDRDLALLGHAREAAGQALDHALLPAAQLGEIDFGLGEGDAVLAEIRGLVDDLGRMQQRLGGDAADIEADAAEHRPAFDQHHPGAEIGGAEGGGIAAGTGAEHQNLGMQVAGRRRGRGGRGGRLSRGGSGGRRLRAFQLQDWRSLADLVADLDHDLRDHARRGRGNFHRRLVGFERDQRVFRLDAVSNLHQHFDHRHILEIADIGDLDFLSHCKSPQSANRRMSSSTTAKVRAKRAAAAPSMTRWS